MDKFQINVLWCITTVIVVLIISAASVLLHENTLIAGMVHQGVDPISAKCAYTSNSVCLARASR
mgnify:CR=1 FL=1